jgi:thioredoxin reductase (NADPH)
MALVSVSGDLGPKSAVVRDFLYRCGIEFEWSTTEISQVVCVFDDGSVLTNPSIVELAQKTGCFGKATRNEYDIVIVGAGPGGISTAIHAAYDGYSALLIDRGPLGGQPASSFKIENYLGFPAISGADLANIGREQAILFGADILLARSAKVTLLSNRGEVVLEDGEVVTAKATVCAPGMEYGTVGVPGESKFAGKGLYYGAGASMADVAKGKEAYVIGGGNSAGQAAMRLAQSARHVHMLVRGADLRATMSIFLMNRVLETPNITVHFRTFARQLMGGERLTHIALGGESPRTVETEWLFACVGGFPQTEWMQAQGIALDDNGFVLAGHRLGKKWTQQRAPFDLETNIPGVFVVGDARQGSTKRIAAAAGDGALVVNNISRYLNEVT